MPIFVISIAQIAGALLGAAGITYLVLALRSLWRFKERPQRIENWDPPVSVLKPVYGDGPGLYECLRSFCQQDWPSYEVIFGAHSEDDPAVPVVRRLIEEFPDRDLRLVIDGTLAGPNRKAANLANIYKSARHDILVVSDSDVRVDADCLASMAAPFADPAVGAVASIYKGWAIGAAPARFGALYVNDWFVPSVLVDEVPHHSTFSANRLGRFRECDLLRHVFERVVWAAMAMGLVKGEGFAVDASVLEANASRYHGKTLDELDWSEKQRQRRAVVEYLAALDETAKPNPDRKAPKLISPSDPASAWTAKANKRVQFGYGLNYLIDIDNAVIVDVEATPARTYDEVAATKTMIDRTEACFDLRPKRLAADTAYGTGKFLGWLVKEKRITPHIPVWEKSDRADGIFSRSQFIWDKRQGHYICPNGKPLRTSGTVHDGRTLLYRASKHDCDACPLRSRCCTRAEARKIPRDLHEDARDVARRKMATKAFARSRDERKRVEMRFAHLKTHHGFERLRLRGLSGARDEFHLAAIVQNLKTMALRLRHPPSQPARL